VQIRGNALVPLTEVEQRRSSFDGGHKIKSVKVIATANGKSTEVDAKYLITDTRMQVFLPQGLNAKGGS
jgi:hypothetical protein